MRADLLIKNAFVLTMDKDMALYEKADIAIKGSQITDISSSLDIPANRTIDVSGKLVMPGLINTHTHAAMTLLRGVSDDVPLDTWLNKFIFPLEKKFVSPEFVKVGAGLAALEMIRSGTTSFVDMYYFEDVAADVFRSIGIRSFLGDAILDIPTPDAKTADEGLRYTEYLHNKWSKDEIVHILVAPHSPYLCSPDTLMKCKALSDKLNLPLHTHLSETKNEVADTKKKFGLSPVQHLERIGFLSKKVTAAHCVHLDDKDMEIMKEKNVKINHCLESNMKLASGISPLPKLIKMGITVGLGTDGAASNNDLDMFGEMGTVAKVHKVESMDTTVVDARTVMKMATSQAAMTLERSDIGSLTIGAKADLIIVDIQVPHMTPLYNIYSQMVYSGKSSDVEVVIVNGKVVLENRKFVNVDEKEIISKANEFSKKIKSTL